MSFNSDALAEIIKSGGTFHKEGAVSFIFTCPRCSKPRKLYIRKKDGRFVCFKCKETNDTKGKAEYILHELFGIPIQELKEKLYGHSDFTFSDNFKLKLKNPFDPEDEDFGYIEPLPKVEWEPQFIPFGQPGFQKGQNYLQGRGVSQQCMLEYDIRYDPKSRRVVIPVKVDGQLVGWQKRYIGKETSFYSRSGELVEIPKILTLKGFEKEKTLMFHDRLLNSNHAVLAEGPFDALKAHLCGGNVATMGKAVSEEQLNIIKNYVNVLYVGLDLNASQEIDQICRKMYDYMDAIYLLPPPKGYEDLGAAPEEAVFEEFKLAKKWTGNIQIYLKGY